MIQKTLTVGLIGVMLLAGCATTGKTVSPEQENQLKINQANYEKTHYRIIHHNQVKVGDGVAELILRESFPATEPDLVIITRSQTVGLNTALVAGALLGAIPAAGAGKDGFKGKVLEPHLRNPILDHAQPIISEWLSTNGAKFAPNDKPITEVAVTAGRFVLIYPKLVGKESYELNTELTVRLKNNWDNRTAYNHFCDIKSKAQPLETWQANDYQAVHTAVKDNVERCLQELNDKQNQIFIRLSK